MATENLIFYHDLGYRTQAQREAYLAGWQCQRNGFGPARESFSEVGDIVPCARKDMYDGGKLVAHTVRGMSPRAAYDLGVFEAKEFQR